MSDSDADIDWYLVRDNRGKPLGALGFIDDEVAVIASFYDDRDANKDGNISIPEYAVSLVSPLGTKGMHVMEVAMAARFDMDVIERDPDFYQLAINMWLKFSRNLVIDGAYAAWMSAAVGQASGAIAKQITGNLVKQFVVKKGLESAVKYAVKKQAGRD